MNTNPEVDAWLASYDNPMKEVVVATRAVLLGADARLGECIKWKSPTFTCGGNLASFNPRSKKHASLMFHVGADIPGDHPVLEGDSKTARTVKIASLDDLAAKKAGLEGVVRSWCDWKS